MSNRRGKRIRIADGIYRDKIGIAAVVRVGEWRKEKRFDRHTPLSEIKDWQDYWRGRFRNSGRPMTVKGTFAADVDYYLDLVKHLAGWVELRAELRAWVKLYGDWRRAKITDAVVLRTRTLWLQAGVKPKTINNRVAALNRLWHRLDGRRAPSPCDEIRPLPVHKVPAQKVPEHHVLIVYATLKEWEDRGMLRDAKTRARFMVYASTGKRPSEIMRAEPGDVDLERRVWIPRDGKGGWGPGIYLNDDMRFAWKIFSEANAWGEFEGNSFVRTLRKAGWPEGVRPYNMRHSVGIGMSEQGVDLADIQQHMGHRRIETTRRHYVPVLGTRLQRASELIDSRFKWAEPNASVPLDVPTKIATDSYKSLQTQDRASRRSRVGNGAKRQ